MKATVAVLGSGVMTLLASCLPPGQKLLTLQVLQGNAVVLSTLFDADDSSTTAQIWDTAGETPFATEVNGLRPSAASPLRAVLIGPVEVRIKWGDTLSSKSTLTGLTLIRSTATSDDWRLPPAEIRRAKKAAGL